MEQLCHMECWCHVPTRGRSKPPCYICVFNNCSLSRKAAPEPSAPPLPPDLETVDLSSSSTAILSPSSASEWSNTTPGIRTSRQDSEDVCIQESKWDEETANTDFEEKSPVYDNDQTNEHVSADDGLSLSERIRSIVLYDSDEEETADNVNQGQAEWSPNSECSETVRNWGLRESLSPVNRRMSCLEPPHIASRSHSADDVRRKFSLSSDTGLNFAEEKKYKMMHKINRRESSAEAASRYFQSDETLHRRPSRNYYHRFAVHRSASTSASLTDQSPQRQDWGPYPYWGLR